MKKITLLLSLCFAIYANAATNITTPTVSGHWTLAGSPYNIYNDIQVASSQSLSIDPGVSVVFQGSYGLQVIGILYAAGSASHLITFTVNDTTGFSTDTLTAAGGWHGIQFNPYSGTGTDTSTLQYCNITYTKFGGGDDGAVPQINTLFFDRTFKVFNCNFNNNKSVPHTNVDLVYVTNTGGNVEFGNCTFHDNSGGPVNVFLAWGPLNIHDSKLYDNLSSGGSIAFVLEGGFNFTNNDLYGNALTGIASAQGILSILGNATIKGNKIHDNIISKCAAVYCGGGFIDIIDNIVCNNQHTSGLCGIVDGGGGLNLCLNSTILHSNTFYNVKNNIIANNYSPFQGGAIKIFNAGANITNNQIINNSSVSHAAVYIYDDDTSSYIVRNNIFYGNVQGSLPAVNCSVIDAIIYYGNIEYDHNWQQAPTAGELNVTGIAFTTSGDTSSNIVGADPGLTAPTMAANVMTSAISADFSLLSTSACIDKGDTTSIVTETTDYAGRARISGSKIDIGAYEYTSGVLNTQLTSVVENSLQVYPNPAQGVIYISVPDAKGSIYLMDVSGRQLLQTYVTATISSLDVHSISKGVYFMVWDNGSGLRTTQKIVVE